MEVLAEPAATLGDAAARDRVRTDLDATLFVEAGAGTGKTAALVWRIVALVDSGRAELAGIAAISFTEAAAAELRERIRRALLDGGDLLDPIVAERRAAAVDQVDEAALTTIHGFAHRVLAEHPLEAGLPLRFEVLDEIGASLVLERRFAQFLDALYDDVEARDLVGAAELLRVSPDHLRSLFWQIDERRESAAARRRPHQPGDASAEDLARIARIAPAVEASIAATVGACRAAVAMRVGASDPADLLFDRLTRIEGDLARLEPEADWLDQLGWLVGLREQKVGNLGRQDAWGEPSVGEVRDAVRVFDEARLDAVRTIADVVMTALGSRLETEVASFAEDRRRSGTLQFHDLLVFARDLVRSSVAVRRELQQRYRYILVDEFQDTDPLQVELVLALGSEGRDGPVVPGRLFFVGDPMQSIYRFRGADLASYHGTRAILGGPEPVRLSTNFRSVPGVLDFVNEVFGRLVGEDASGVPERTEEFSGRPGEPAREPVSPLVFLGAARGPLPGQPPVVLVGSGDPELTARTRRERESADVATIIAEAVETAWPVEDPAGTRPARYGDVAVLVPTRTGLGELEAAFESAGIEFRFAESSLVYASSEVRDLLAVLRAVEDRGDDRDVIAALRTPAFGCSDRDLVEHRAAGGTWRLGAVVAGRVDPVAAGLADLAELSLLTGRLGVVELLETVVKRRKLRQQLAAGRHPLEALRRLEFVLERARGFVDAGGTSLSEMLAFMEQEAVVGVRRSDAALALGDPDAVRVLTVHGAKGLEFPIVVLAELGGPPRPATRGPAVFRSGAGRIELSIRSGLATSGFAALRDAEAAEARREAVRLCYVAATRARDHLVVSLHHRPSAGGERSLAELVAGAAPTGLPSGPGAGPLPGSPLQGRFVLGAPPRIDEAGYDRVLEARRELLAFVAAPSRVVATALEGDRPPRRSEGSPGAGSSDPGREEVDDGGISWRRARAATRVGRAVHSVLQRIDLRSGEDLAGLVRHAAAVERCEEDSEEIAHLVGAALGSASVREAAASPMLHRELPFALPVPGGLLEGVVDLCYRTPDGLVGVDYKTDALGERDVLAEHALRYRLQVGAYAYALGELTGEPLARFVLVFLAAPTGAVEVEVADLAGAASAALAAASSLLGADGSAAARRG